MAKIRDQNLKHSQDVKEKYQKKREHQLIASVNKWIYNKEANEKRYQLVQKDLEIQKTKK